MSMSQPKLSLRLMNQHAGRKNFNPISQKEQEIAKMEQELGDILNMKIAAEGARQSRLESLKTKLNKFATQIRDAQKQLRDRMMSVLRDQKESFNGISFEELASASEQELQDEENAKRLTAIQRRIAVLRSLVQKVTSELLD